MEQRKKRHPIRWIFLLVLVILPLGSFLWRGAQSAMKAAPQETAQTETTYAIEKHTVAAGSTSGAVPLTVESCEWEGSLVSVTVQNPTGRCYQGAYWIGLFSAQDTASQLVYFQPYGYYEAIDQHSGQSHSNDTVLPAGQSETLVYVLDETVQAQLEELQQNGQSLYAAFWISGQTTDPQFCPVTAPAELLTMPEVTRADGVVVAIAPETQTETTQ